MAEKTIERARQMRREPTNVERKLWSKLRDRQLAGVHFRRQHPIDPYIADFAAPARRLVVELDGSQFAQAGLAYSVILE